MRLWQSITHGFLNNTLFRFGYFVSPRTCHLDEFDDEKNAINANGWSGFIIVYDAAEPNGTTPERSW